MNTTNPDGDENQEATRQHEREVFALAMATLADHECRTCDSYGYKHGAICPDCSGTGLAPQFLVQHPDFKREQQTKEL